MGNTQCSWPSGHIIIGITTVYVAGIAKGQISEILCYVKWISVQGNISHLVWVVMEVSSLFEFCDFLLSFNTYLFSPLFPWLQRTGSSAGPFICPQHFQAALRNCNHISCFGALGVLPAQLRQELFLGASRIGLTSQQGTQTCRAVFKGGREKIVLDVLRLYGLLLCCQISVEDSSPLQPPCSNYLKFWGCVLFLCMLRSESSA